MLLSLQIMATLAWKEIPCVENLQIGYWVNCRNTNISGYCCQRSVFGDCYRNMRHFLCSVERIKRFVNVHLHCIVSSVPSECANTQDHQNCSAVKSHSRALATFQSNGKACKQEAIRMKCYFVRIWSDCIFIIEFTKFEIHWKLHLLSPKIIMLTKTNIFSVQNYLRGNTDRRQFENDKQNVYVAPRWKKLCGRPWMIVLSRFRFFVTFVLSLIANYLFLSVLLVSVAK